MPIFQNNDYNEIDVGPFLNIIQEEIFIYSYRPIKFPIAMISGLKCDVWLQTILRNDEPVSSKKINIFIK